MEMTTTALNLESLTLLKGSHQPPTAGAEPQCCIMEVVSMLAKEPWGDEPQCVAPSIRRLLMVLDHE